MLSKGGALFKDYLVDFLYWAFGSVLYSVSVNSFSAPNQIAPGGLSGIATLINHQFAIPIGLTIIVLNIPLFLLGWRFLGLAFVMRTGIVTAMISLSIDLIPPLFDNYSSDRLLAALFAGFINGFCISLFFLRGATSGGTDIAARLIKLKYPYVSIGKFIIGIDIFIVVASALVYKSIESGLYTITVIFISSTVLDRMLYGASSAKLLFIVTQRPKEICSEISLNLHRGATVIESKGAYTGEQSAVILCAARKNETSKLKKSLKVIDPYAFAITVEAGEVVGNGFAKNTE